MKEQNIKVQKGEKNWVVTLKFPEESEESEQIHSEEGACSESLQIDSLRREIVEVLSGTLLEECR